jgi:hypothetical protein
MDQISNMPSVATTVAQTSEFSWGAVGAWGAFLSLLAIIVRQVGPWRQITQGAEQKLRNDLLGRVGVLEKKLDKERAIHNAERAIDRHVLNNVTQCFDAVLLMLEAAPEKATEIVAKIRHMRDAQIKAEAAEKAAIHAMLIRETGEENIELERT